MEVPAALRTAVLFENETFRCERQDTQIVLGWVWVLTDTHIFFFILKRVQTNRSK